MAWSSDETKMDTGQLYVTTDGGETYHKVCELKEIRETEEDSLISDYIFQQLLYNLMLDRDATLYYIGGRGHGKTRLIMEITKKLLEYKYALDKNVSKLTTKFIFGPIEGKEYDDTLDALLYCIKLQDKVNKILPTDFKFVEKRVDYSDIVVGADIGVGGLHQRTSQYPVAKSIREKAEAEAEWKPFHKNFEEDINKEKENKTMEARKCDRCGNLYEAEDMESTIKVEYKFAPVPTSVLKTYTPEALKEYKSSKVTISRSVGLDPDLCPECRAAFKNWWENPNKILVDECGLPDEEEKSNG